MLHNSSFGQLSVHGKDAAILLQGQLTVDITAMKSAIADFFALCNARGLMLANGVIIRPQANEYRLLVDSSLIQTVHNVLKKYAPFYHVTIEVVDEPLGYCASNEESSFSFSGLDTTLAIGVNATDNDCQKWRLNMLRQGIVFLVDSQSGQFQPAELGWDAFGVSFSKGCYTGQEIIARIHYRGSLKHDLYIAETDTTDEDIITADGVACGTVVCAMPDDKKTVIAAKILKAKAATANIGAHAPQWLAARKLIT